MTKGARPQRIDFSDELDQPMGSAMDRAVQEAMNRRGAQLAASRAQHAGTRHNAEKWLGIQEHDGQQNARQVQQQSQVQQQQQAAVRPLKIGAIVPGEELGAVPIANQPAAAERHVRFAAAPSSSPDAAAPSSSPDAGAQRFLSSLKRDEPHVAPPMVPPLGPSLAPQLDGINESLKRIADGLAELVATMNEKGTPPVAPGAPSVPSPVPSPGSGPAEIDLSPDADGNSDT